MTHHNNTRSPLLRILSYTAPFTVPPHKRPAPPHSSESGNAIFLILIAVVLFAALGFAVSQSTRSSAGGGQEENISLRAAQIIQYATYAEQSMLRIRMAGIDPAAICFDHDGWGHDDYDHAGCALIQNQIFSTHPDGGGVSWAKPIENVNDGSPWYIPANVCVAGIGNNVNDNCHTDGTGESEDLILVLPNVRRDICIELNERLSIANPNGAPPKAAGSLFDTGMPKFNGTFADGAVINNDTTNILRGQNFACVESGGPVPPEGTFVFYHVLLPR